ncbi:hypothetical protein [Methanococcus voltae]|uniref:hypothetical protein n=1 Tax=Methanococcus voltae TaxID=2188 RepID=UPI001AE854A0|nr:hypothetical protein [Methanococcus voltae]MBP2173078.1 hypothetical protein [Methanococcus voltae]
MDEEPTKIENNKIKELDEDEKDYGGITGYLVIHLTNFIKEIYKFASKRHTIVKYLIYIFLILFSIEGIIIFAISLVVYIFWLLAIIVIILRSIVGPFI